MSPEGELHPPEWIAERLHQSVDWVIKRVRSQDLYGRKIGRRWWFTEQDYLDYVEKCRSGSNDRVRSARSEAARNRRKGRAV